MKILIKLLTVLMSVLLIIGIQFPILASNEELEDLLIELNAVPGEVIELPEMKELIIITAEHMPAVETGEEKPNKQIVKLNFQFNEILLNANSVMTVSKQGEKAALLQKSVTGDISITDLFIDFPYTVSFYTELDGHGISYSGTLRILEKGKDEKHLEILDNLYAYAYLLHDDLPVTRSVSSPEYEPNDTMSDANHMEGDDTRFGKISVREDVDYYKVQLGYDGKANFWLGDIPTGKDYDLYLYNSAGEQIARSATSGNAEPIFDFDVVQEETYYMKVVGYNGSNDSENYYQIRAKMISYTHEDDYGNTYYDAITIEEGQEITAQIDYVGDVDFFLIVFGTPPDINDSNYYSLYTTGSLDTYGIFGEVKNPKYIPSEYEPVYETWSEDDDSGGASNFKINNLYLLDDSHPDAPLMYFVKVSALGNETGTYTLHFEKETDDIGNTPDKAKKLSMVNEWRGGRLNGVEDVDYFRISIGYNRVFRVISSLSRDVIEADIYDENLNLIGQLKGGNEPYYDLKMYKSEDYYIRVQAGILNEACDYLFRFEEVGYLDDPDTFDDSGKPELQTLLSNREYEATFENAGDVDCFAFKPLSTGSYNICTIGDINTRAVLYDSDKTTPISYSYSQPDDDNACLSKTLEDSKIYYFKIYPEEFTSDQDVYKIKVTENKAPNDTYFDDQWGLMNQGNYDGGTINTMVGVDCNVLPAWKFSTGKNIKIGILDSGIDTFHNELSAKLILPGKNTVHNTPDIYPTDELIAYDENGNSLNNTALEGHGTHVAGIVAAASNNNLGIASVAPDAKIIGIKALGTIRDSSELEDSDDNGNRSTNSTVMEGIEYAASQGIDIVNMSIQHFNYSPSLEDTIKNADDMLFVTISGNDSENLDTTDLEEVYPGMYDANNLITVASLSSDGTQSDFSNYGGQTDLAAPGDDILSTFPNQEYVYSSGTSMAAPFVSGAAALIWSKYPNLTPQEIKHRILNNVTLTDNLADKVRSGGYLNIYAALCDDQYQNQDLLTINDTNSFNQLTIQDKKQLITRTKAEVDDKDKTNEFFVKFEGDCEVEDILSNALNGIEFEIIKQFELSGAYFVRTNSVSDADIAIDRLNELELVEYASPNYYIEIQ